MCRPIPGSSEGSMYLMLYCSLVVWIVCLSSQSATAADLDIYPELGYGDETILKRIRHVLNEWREKQLRLQHLQEQEAQPVPQFTYHFPEDNHRSLQSDYFAVPPSDPRYYQDPPLPSPQGPRYYQDPPVPSPQGPRYYQDPPLSSPQDNSIVYDDKRLENNNVDSQPDSESGQVGTPLTARSEEDDTEVTDVTSAASEELGDEDASYIFKRILNSNNKEDFILVGIVAGCGAAAAAAVVCLSIGWYKLHNNSKAAADIEYPAYGVTGPNKEITPTGDRRLAQSAQMYHYQHQKQQIIAMESNRVNNERRGSVSEGDSDEENEEGDYTVYECPGLAATGELEVKNPLFLDDPTPAPVNQNEKADDAPTSNN